MTDNDEFAEQLTALAEQVSPLKGNCPNKPKCGHAGYLHDIEDDDDPLPMCGVHGCRCGHAPAGWLRVPGQAVIPAGGTVPAGMDTLGLNGVVHTADVHAGVEWVNGSGGPLVEVERARRSTSIAGE